MKKEYIKPEAEKISFQAEEVMATDIDGSFGGDGGIIDMHTVDWRQPPLDFHDGVTNL